MKCNHIIIITFYYKWNKSTVNQVALFSELHSKKRLGEIWIYCEMKNSSSKLMKNNPQFLFYSIWFVQPFIGESLVLLLLLHHIISTGIEDFTAAQYVSRLYFIHKNKINHNKYDMLFSKYILVFFIKSTTTLNELIFFFYFN